MNENEIKVTGLSVHTLTNWFVWFMLLYFAIGWTYHGEANGAFAYWLFASTMTIWFLASLLPLLGLWCWSTWPDTDRWFAGHLNQDHATYQQVLVLQEWALLLNLGITLVLIIGGLVLLVWWRRTR